MDNLILKDSCYVQDTCKKYKNNECTDLFCVRLYKIHELYNKSLLTLEQRKSIRLFLDENRIDEIPYMALQQYQQNIVEVVNSGKNLFIYSQITGNGKTSWAIKLLQSYISKIWASSDLVCRALFVNVPKFTRELKLNITKSSDYINHINDNILSADIVVWDDIAIKSASDYEHEQFLSILDSRLDDKKCNIFTSNIPPDSLQDYLGARLTSRIVGLSECICFNGTDKRGCAE